MCSDLTNWYIYTSDIVIGTGIVYCTRNGHIDSGPGSPSDLVLSSWEWWPLAVAGGVRQFRLYS